MIKINNLNEQRYTFYLSILMMAIFSIYLFDSSLSDSSFGILEIGKQVFLLGILTVLSIEDCKSNIVPNRILVDTLIIRLIILLIEFVLYKNDAIVKVFLKSLVGFFVGGVIFVLPYLIKNNAIGMGDIKLCAIIGSFVGFEDIMIIIFIASFVTLLTFGILFLLKKFQNYKTLPYVPFISLGVLILFTLEI